MRAAEARSLVAVVALAAVGCGASAAEGYPGASSQAPQAPTPSASAAPPPLRWTQFDEAKGWPPVNDEPFTSRGHAGGRWTLTVRVSPDARDAYAALTPGSSLPSGAVVAAFHHDPARGRPGPIYVMEKASQRWRFTVVNPDGLVREGSVALCARCHAEAVADHLFGLPRPAK